MRWRSVTDRRRGGQQNACHSPGWTGWMASGGGKRRSRRRHDFPVTRRLNEIYISYYTILLMLYFWGADKEDRRRKDEEENWRRLRHSVIVSKRHRQPGWWRWPVTTARPQVLFLLPPLSSTAPPIQIIITHDLLCGWQIGFVSP